MIAYAFLSGALCVLLGASWIGVSLAAGLGLVTGAALLLSERVPPRYSALITVAIAFLVAVVVFLLLKAGWGSGILAAPHRSRSSCCCRARCSPPRCSSSRRVT